MRTLQARDKPRPMVWPAKDANEVLDYSIDFSARLGCDTIASATFSLATAAGLTIDSSEHDSNATATVTLSAGTEGGKGKVLCRITTANGNSLDEAAHLPIRAR